MTENNSNNHLIHRLFSKSLKQNSNYEELSENVVNYEMDRKPCADSRIPWRGICLALFLLIIGFILILISFLILFGFIVSIKPNDGLIVLLFLGAIMVIPGYYHIRIAYYAYRQYDGYSFEDIPDFD